MTNQQAARYNLQRAKIILEEAEHLKDQKAWNLVVRRCQEAVELALKGALLWIGINVPRIHDVGGILVQHTERFPEDLRPELQDGFSPFMKDNDLRGIERFVSPGF